MTTSAAPTWMQDDVGKVGMKQVAEHLQRKLLNESKP
jgi:hypothetical protein